MPPSGGHGTAAVDHRVLLFGPHMGDGVCRRMDEMWDKALMGALQYRIQSSIQQRKTQDPWHRALLSCVTAQRIRQKRSRTSQRKTLQDFSKSTKQSNGWDEGLRMALAGAKAIAYHHRTECKWTYALKIKVTAWNMKSRECSQN